MTVAKVQLNNTWELSAVPSLPVLDLVAEHCANLSTAGADGMMLSWSLGGYPSPNLEVARRTWGNGTGAAWTQARVFDLFPHLAALAARQAGRLSGGEQQMLTIARTLMGSPEILLLDEPSEGLAPLVVEMLREQLGRLKASGLTIILAEQNVRFVSGLGDRVYILEKGMVRYRGSMAEFLADDEARQAYLAL